MLNLKAKLVKELPRLRRFAHGLTGNTPDADDLVQSLVEKLLTKEQQASGQKSGEKPEQAPEVPWLLRVCKNLWIDQLRTNANRAKLQEQNQEQIQPKQEQSGPQDDNMNQIALAIEQLNDEQKQLVVLVIVEGYSYAEAAQTLDIPVGTVMSRVARARGKLMEILSEQKNS